uniref:Ras-GAP domain-containing protein n=1 Tax=Panagrolaimus davidi TaxID=227884 RepID=A0A914PZY0_9BILA
MYMKEIRKNGIKNKEELKNVILKINGSEKDLVKEKLKKAVLDINDIREVINITEEITYEEEILIEKRRSKVANLIEVNEKLKTDLEDLEKSLNLYKIGEMPIDEILKQIEVIKIEEEGLENRHENEQIAKEHRISLNPLEIIFYYFQTDPTYLSNFFSWDKIQAKDFVNTIALPIFDFGKDEREEILLVRVFAKILTKYIGSLKNFEQFLDESWDANKVVIAFKAMLQSLPSNRIATLFSKSDLAEFKKAEAAEQHLNFSPIQMYEKLYNRHAKSLEEATKDSEVSKILSNSKKFLSKWTILFTKKAAESLEIPRNVRYLLKICANKLRRHFKNLEKKDADRFVAKFFYSTFFEDYLQTHNKKVIDPSLTKRQKEIIHLIIEMMELGADGKGFSDDFGYMQSLNSTLIQINDIFT